MGLIPNIDMPSTAQRLERKLDRIIELLEGLFAARLHEQGLSPEEIEEMLGCKR